MSIGRCVFTPWPPSGFLAMMVTAPSGAMRTKARGSTALKERRWRLSKPLGHAVNAENKSYRLADAVILRNERRSRFIALLLLQSATRQHDE